MEILTQNFKRNPNELISSMYSGVAPGNRTVTTIVKPSADRNRMEATRVYGPAIPRGQGGRIGVLVLGGMETTLDEVQDILEAHRQQKFVPQRNQSEIAQMCRMVADRRNELIMAARRKVRGNPSEAPKKPKKGLYLPKGFKFVRTKEPGLEVTVRA